MARSLVALSKTELRSGDHDKLSRLHIKRTKSGLRIVINTEKRKLIVSLPVTPRMKNLIDDTPADHSILFIAKKASPCKHPTYLGDPVSTATDDIRAECKKRGTPAPFRANLRLYVARGNAAIYPDMTYGLGEKMQRLESRTKNVNRAVSNATLKGVKVD